MLYSLFSIDKTNSFVIVNSHIQIGMFKKSYMNNWKGLIAFLFLICLLSISESSFGQGGPGNANAGSPGNANAGSPGNPVTIPVDGGLTIFLGLGAAYGAKRIYDVVKNKEGKVK